MEGGIQKTVEEPHLEKNMLYETGKLPTSASCDLKF